MPKGLEYFEKLEFLEGRKFTPLEAAAHLLAALGSPQDQVRAVHVAGTNGKGTVCALIAAMLSASGASVGQTSSPHLVSPAERCIVNGATISEADFGAAIEAVVEVAEREHLAPSYFVLGVIAAFYEFSRRKLDWMLVEVGLGGRLDATNLILKPAATLITSISADHTEILGTSQTEIAWNKAGIAKLGVPMFVGQVCKEAELSIRACCAEVGAPVEFLNQDFSYRASDDALVIGGIAQTAHLCGLHLAGNYQRDNAALAVRVARHLGLSDDAIRQGIATARWPGRLEYLWYEGQTVLLDIAHNPAGLEALEEHLRETVPGQFSELVLLISILDRKDWKRMLNQFRDFETIAACRWIFTESGNPSAVPARELRAYFGKGEIQANPGLALEEACSEGSSEVSLILVTGSAFLVGRLRPKITPAPLRTIQLLPK